MTASGAPGTSQSTGVSTRGQNRSVKASASGQRAVREGEADQHKNWEAPEENHSTLKPVKQTVSAGVGARTTRSKSKGKQQDEQMET